MSEAKEPKVPQILKFLLSVADELKKEDLKKMKFLCQNFIAKGQLESIEDPVDLVIILQEKKAVGEGNLGLLKDLVRVVGRNDLETRIEEYEMDNSTKKYPETESDTPHQPLPAISGIRNPTPTRSLQSQFSGREGDDSAVHQSQPSVSSPLQPELVDETPERFGGPPPPISSLPMTPQRDGSAQSFVARSPQSPAGALVLDPSVESDAAGAGVEAERISLRDYQRELKDGAIQQNTIVSAPTGSGKTLVAAEVAKWHMMQSPDPKQYNCVFLVDKVPLVEQQRQKFEDYLKPELDWFKVAGLTGNNTTSLEALLKDNQVIVLTAQVLVNHLQGRGDFQKISISLFDLLIFDECHHTHDKHPYNLIMNEYHDVRGTDSRAKLPKILGLTASVGTGRATTVEGALDHVYRLCANLDAPNLVQVRKHVHELKAHVVPPEANVEAIQSRLVDPFRDAVHEAMQSLEIEHLQSHVSFSRGTPQYESWAQEKRSMLLGTSGIVPEFCARCLIYLSRALEINDNCRMTDGRVYLETFVREYLEYQLDDAKVEILSKLADLVKHLRELEKNQNKYPNPKLVYLEELLKQRYKDAPDSLCILFTRTRFSTRALEKWINSSQQLCFLNASRLTGASAVADSMSKSKQQEVIEKFSVGESKIMVATTVAIQGLDIKACNTVIRYGLVTDEIAMVQARGRARAEKSQITALHHLQGRGPEKERENELKEKTMEEALNEFDLVELDEIQKVIAKIQKRDFELRKMAKQPEVAKGRYDPKLIKFFCKECQSFLCTGDAIRKLWGVHRVVVDSEFSARAKWPKEARLVPPSEGTSVDGILFCESVKCQQCRKKIGVVMQKAKESTRFPALTMKDMLWSYGSSPTKSTVGKAAKKDFDKSFEDL